MKVRLDLEQCADDTEGFEDYEVSEEITCPCCRSQLRLVLSKHGEDLEVELINPGIITPA